MRPAGGFLMLGPPVTLTTAEGFEPDAVAGAPDPAARQLRRLHQLKVLAEAAGHRGLEEGHHLTSMGVASATTT